MSILPDIQKTVPKIKRPLHKVGIRNMRIPLHIKRKGFSPVEVPVDVSAYISLDESQKGANMSRFPRALFELSQFEICDLFIEKALKKLQEMHQAESVYLKLRFPYRIEGVTLKSDLLDLHWVDVTLEGVLSGDKITTYLTEKIQYISTCPCSKELTLDLEKKGLRGAPHMQRAYVIPTVEMADFIWIEDLFDTVVSSLGYVIPHTVVKREDEQEIARITWENPYFVEDVARLVANALDKMPEVADWVVVVESEESIHYHNAVAVVYKGKEGGLR